MASDLEIKNIKLLDEAVDDYEDSLTIITTKNHNTYYLPTLDLCLLEFETVRTTKCWDSFLQRLEYKGLIKVAVSPLLEEWVYIDTSNIESYQHIYLKTVLANLSEYTYPIGLYVSHLTYDMEEDSSDSEY